MICFSAGCLSSNRTSVTPGLFSVKERHVIHYWFVNIGMSFFRTFLDLFQNSLQVFRHLGARFWSSLNNEEKHKTLLLRV